METPPTKTDSETGTVRVIEKEFKAPKVYKVSGLAALLIGLPLILIFGFVALIVALVLLAAVPFTLLANIRRTQKKLRDQVKAEYKNIPWIPSDTIPSYAKASGYVVQEMFQAPGMVEYRDGAIHYQPTLGKETTVPLTDVKSFRFGAGLQSGSYFPGYKTVTMNLTNGKQMGFTVTTIEPWRSILSSVAEDRTLDKSIRVEKI
jgi:hypothetical protein